MMTICIAVFLMAGAVYTQCVPDPSHTAPGIYPKQLPNAHINSFYSETLTVVTPDDTTVNGVYVLIDSIQVTSIKGLPPSIIYQCDNPLCKWKGGTKGCILLQGTPTWSEYGLHPLVAYETVRVILNGQPLYTYDSTTSYALFVDWPYGVEVYLPSENHSQTAEIYDVYGRTIGVMSRTSPAFYIVKLSDGRVTRRVILPSPYPH